jgi:hypothetical protein
MMQEGLTSPLTCAGDNLYVQKWIERLMKCNKSITLSRDDKQMQKDGFDFVYTAIENGNNVLLAQTPGRSYDYSFRTRGIMLKIQHDMARPETSFKEWIEEHPIHPLAITYECDPTIMYKAEKNCTRREAKKRGEKPPQISKEEKKQEDNTSMKTEILGQKGKVYVTFGSAVTPASYNDVAKEITDFVQDNMVRTATQEALDSAIDNYGLEHVVENPGCIEHDLIAKQLSSTQNRDVRAEAIRMYQSIGKKEKHKAA